MRKSRPSVALRRFHLIVADGLIQKRLRVLVDQPLAHDHAGGFAEVGGDPAAAEFFGDGGGGAGAAVEVGDDVSFWVMLNDASVISVGFCVA